MSKNEGSIALKSPGINRGPPREPKWFPVIENRRPFRPKSLLKIKLKNY